MKFLLTRLCLVVLVLFVVACQTPGDEGENPWSTPEPGANDTIFVDDFSPPNSAWVRFDTPESAVYALEGELYLEDRGKGVGVYTPLGSRSYADVTVAVQLRHVQGSVNNWMGIICRQQDEDNYYLFAVSADGFYLILKSEEGITVPIVGPESNPLIQEGKADNYLQVRCRDDRLTLWINETLVVSRVDDAFDSGGVALYADAVEPGEIATVAFDEFKLSSP